MNYRKPEVAKLGGATDAIRGQTHKSVTPADNTTSHLISTPTAYEADE